MLRQKPIFPISTSNFKALLLLATLTTKAGLKPLRFETTIEDHQLAHITSIAFHHIAYASKTMSLEELLKSGRVELVKTTIDLEQFELSLESLNARQVLDRALEEFRKRDYENEELTLSFSELETAFHDTVGFVHGRFQANLPEAKKMKAKQLGIAYQSDHSESNPKYAALVNRSPNQLKQVINQWIDPEENLISDHQKSEAMLKPASDETESEFYTVVLYPNNPKVKYRTEVRIRKTDFTIASIEQITEFTGDQYIAGQSVYSYNHERIMVTYAQGKFPQNFESKRMIFVLNNANTQPDRIHSFNMKMTTETRSLGEWFPLDLGKPLFAQ